jgi:hypothetical protein
VQRGDEYVATIRICVSGTGHCLERQDPTPVDSGDRSADPNRDPEVALPSLPVNGQASDFCYNMNYRVK